MNDSKKIIFFDGVCGLCNHTVDFLFKVKAYEHFFFASLQGETAKNLLSPSLRENLDSVILYQNKDVYKEALAIQKIFLKLKFPYRFLGFFLSITPAFIKNWGYGLVARNRYRFFGKRETCRLPQNSEKKFFLN